MRLRLSIPMGAVFWAILGFYALVIGGILFANVFLVAGTPLGRVQFVEVIRDRDVLHAVWLSVWTSSVSAIISMLIAVPAGFLMSRQRGKLVALVDALVDVPIILPPLLFGISLLVLFQRTGVGPALRAIGLRFVHEPAGIVLVQVLIASAYGARMLKGAFDGLDARLAAVARTLGCSRGQAFCFVTLPAIRSSLVSTAVVVWARALALYGPIIAFVGATSGYTEVMPTRMFLEMSVGRLEAALAVSLIMIAMAVPVLVIVKLADRTGAEEMKHLVGI